MSQPALAPPSAVPPPAAPVALPESHKGITVIATLKLIKGTVLVLTALGALELRGRDLDGVLQWFIDHTHIAPEGRLVTWVLDHLDALTDNKLRFIGEAGLVYGLFQLVESYGLFGRRAWAEWLVVVATTLPVPYELYELLHHATLTKLGIITVNVAIAGYLWYRRSEFLTRGQRKALKRAIRAGSLGKIDPAPESEGPDHEVLGRR